MVEVERRGKEDNIILKLFISKILGKHTEFERETERAYRVGR